MDPFEIIEPETKKIRTEYWLCIVSGSRHPANVALKFRTKSKREGMWQNLISECWIQILYFSIWTKKYESRLTLEQRCELPNFTIYFLFFHTRTVFGKLTKT